MPIFFPSNLEPGTPANFLTDSDFSKGGFRTAVSGTADLLSISINHLKAHATFVYVSTPQKWYFYTGDATANNTLDDWSPLELGSNTSVTDGSTTTTGAALTAAANGGLSVAVTGDTFTYSLNGNGSLTSGDLTKWDGSKLVDSLVSESNYNVTIGTGTAGNDDNGGTNNSLNVHTLNVTTINAANTYTSASISTSDTFLRLADPTTSNHLADGATEEVEYARAVNAGFVVNTGFYDDDTAVADADNLAYSTHKLLFWNAGFSEWMLQDGKPEGLEDATTNNGDSDEFDNAESNLVSGTSHFLRNFYHSAATAQFGLPEIFNYNHATSTNDPEVHGSGYMKTRYVIMNSTMYSWVTFDQGAAMTATDGTEYLTDYTWTDSGADNAANTMADTYVRTARVIRAKVALEGDDLQGNGNDIRAYVYHGGLFGTNDIPVVRCYVKTGGTEGTNGVYEEIIVRTIIDESSDYVEISFNSGYLTTTAGDGNNDGNSLYVRMIA